MKESQLGSLARLKLLGGVSVADVSAGVMLRLGDIGILVEDYLMYERLECL